MARFEDEIAKIVASVTDISVDPIEECQSVDCPTCHARPGASCMEGYNLPDGWRAAWRPMETPHHDRIELWARRKLYEMRQAKRRW